MSETDPETGPRALYIPAGNWLVKTLTEYCSAARLGNVAVSGIGSITDIWMLLNPDGQLEVRNFPGPGSYEMTSLAGNVVLRQGVAQFNAGDLPSGAYPRFDRGVSSLNPYAHVHATFALPNFAIAGGHLLDAAVSIGAELWLSPLTTGACPPGSPPLPLPACCVVSEPVTVPPFGTFSNWDSRWWFPSASGAATASDPAPEEE
jgi:predicted DNA-binding protein with PD1-like motif